MKKRIERIGLSVILVLALASFANGAVSMVDATSYEAIVSEVVVVTIVADATDPSAGWDWGVYLQSDYANADLQNALVIKTSQAVQGAGNNASITLTDPASYDGDDYQASQGGTQANKMIYPSVNWSTVEFVASAIGTYYIELYDYTTDGGTYSSPNAVADAKTINVVPEPATIALLGLGGLFLTRRRRRG